MIRLLGRRNWRWQEILGALVRARKSVVGRGRLEMLGLVLNYIVAARRVDTALRWHRGEDNFFRKRVNVFTSGKWSAKKTLFYHRQQDSSFRSDSLLEKQFKMKDYHDNFFSHVQMW